MHVVCHVHANQCMIAGRVKAEPCKTFPDPKPNETDVEQSIKQVISNDPELTELNLNNIQVSVDCAYVIIADNLATCRALCNITFVCFTCKPFVSFICCLM